MKFWILVVMFCITTFACSREPTQDKARDMFREPSSEKQGKIPEKFQPLDHKINKASENEL